MLYTDAYGVVFNGPDVAYLFVIHINIYCRNSLTEACDRSEWSTHANSTPVERKSSADESFRLAAMSHTLEQQASVPLPGP